ncbi:TIGR01777 family oxidoreductase [Pseudidiomarina sediminum]|uniref:TIGR01777 family oxidoreductase n=1 Tax=Pseudidiomarina sediminum TaxID=431675 RepID=UPI001C966A24|nr:TIGR01777 family oxidoreductase [Pseudidiomarina sediminum]MBY6063283.1 TIGR01777 family oxidoreductase [Pseudidiomarina sediminum]
MTQQQKILITGGTGLIGSALIKALRDRYAITVTTRQPQQAERRFGAGVLCVRELPSLEDYLAVINLQGESIAGKRWSAQQKHRLQQSRWNITSALAEAIQNCETPPKVLISGSAIGYYGAQDATEMTENTQVNYPDDFAQQLCAEWEHRARAAASERTRVCIVRTGVVLAKEGSALQKMLPPYLLGLGGPLGSGEQYFSWIHLEDMVRALTFLLEQESCEGVYNATAPEPVTQEVFSRSIAKTLRKSHFMRVPAWVLKLALGEMAQVLLTGQRVVPARLQDAGFTFNYPTADAALRDCLLPPSSD